MTYKYRPTYNRETQAYAYLDFDFEFRMHTPAQNAHKFLCKLIEEHVWLRIPLPTPRENKGRLVTVEITWNAACTRSTGRSQTHRSARDAARFAALDSCKMDTEDLDTVRDNRGNIYR